MTKCKNPKLYHGYDIFRRYLSSKLFINFFNKFLTLPVFGQLIYYDFNEKQFKTFPHSSHKYDIDEQHLVTWIYKYRYQRFIQTSFFAEFLLCEQFSQASFSSGLDSEVAVAFDFLQHKFIESSSAMKKFRDYLRKHESATVRYVTFFDENMFLS